MTRILEVLCRQAVENEDRLLFLNYADLTPENIPDILRLIDYTESQAGLEQMVAQMTCYSKADGNTAVFASDGVEKRQKMTPEIQKVIDRDLWPLFEHFENSYRNFRHLR